MSQILVKSVRCSLIRKLLPAVLLACTHFAGAQRVEIGLTAGLSNYIGDVAPTIVPSESYPGGSAFIRLNLSKSFAWTNAGLITRLTGSDKNFKANQNRNITFRTDLIEYSSVIEFNYLKYGVGVLDNRATSYLFAGLSLFYFNPKFFYGNGWSGARGKQTEGVKYGEYAVAIPFGIGYKLQLNRTMSLEMQFGFRKALTDYLDDVSNTYANMAVQREKGEKVAWYTDPGLPDESGYVPDKSGKQRGNPDFDDWYMFSGISISWRLYGLVKCARFY